MLRKSSARATLKLPRRVFVSFMSPAPLAFLRGGRNEVMNWRNQALPVLARLEQGAFPAEGNYMPRITFAGRSSVARSVR